MIPAVLNRAQLIFCGEKVIKQLEREFSFKCHPAGEVCRQLGQECSMGGPFPCTPSSSEPLAGLHP